MSVEMDSSTEVIFVRLRGEGTIVFRPAYGKIDRDGIAVLRSGEDYDPNSEDWEFGPGERVRCEQQMLEGELVWVAVRATDETKPQGSE